jgi:DNA-binding winged helix-turn-helix (wHTH) protein/TolB-like protein/tetratricopeptide (TPR) repeat protein
MDLAVARPPRGIDLASEPPFRVGRASIDPVSRDAAFGGATERLQPQNLKVLVALAQRRPTVVTREELIDLCWDGRFVGDDVINRSISLLRQFAERAGGFEIQTVPKSGYRLVEASDWSTRQRRWMIAAAAAIPLALAGIAIFEWPGRESARPMPTIAILPFTTASADAQGRELASNARDALAHMLSRTEYKVQLLDTTPRDSRAAPDFVASANVGGTSNKVVVTVRVEDTAHDAIVYSNQFEAARSEADGLPDQIGAQIAGSLGWTASLLMLEKSHPSDPAITGELFGGATNYQTARQIAARAPNSAIAQTALGFSATDAIWDLPRGQHVEALEVGRRAMERLRVLAPGFGGADILWCFLHSRVRLVECEDHLRAAMRTDPDSVWVENTLGNWLKDVGRTSEALDLARTSLAHDPFVSGKIGLTLRMLEATGRRDEADQLYRDSLRWWPADIVIFSGRIYGAMDRGDFETVARSEKDIAKTPLAPLLRPGLPVLAAVQAKDVVKARELCPVDQAASFKRDLCMLALTRLGDVDDAFAIALRTYPNRVGSTPAEEDKLWLDTSRYGETDILMGPGAAPLRRHPRFLELARSLGLLAYWRSGRLPDFCQPPKSEPICSKLRAMH